MKWDAFQPQNIKNVQSKILPFNYGYKIVLSILVFSSFFFFLLRINAMRKRTKKNGCTLYLYTKLLYDFLFSFLSFSLSHFLFNVLLCVVLCVFECNIWIFIKFSDNLLHPVFFFFGKFANFVSVKCRSWNQNLTFSMTQLNLFISLNIFFFFFKVNVCTQHLFFSSYDWFFHFHIVYSFIC